MVVIEAFKRSLLDYSKKINDCTNTLLNQEATHHGLTAMQLRLLMELHKDGTMAIGEMASQLGQAGTNVSTMCKKLEKLGLIHRQRSAQDERIVMLALTEAGEARMVQINRAFDKKISRMMDVVDEAELREMLSGLEKFSRLLSLNTAAAQSSPHQNLQTEKATPNNTEERDDNEI